MVLDRGCDAEVAPVGGDGADAVGADGDDFDDLLGGEGGQAGFGEGLEDEVVAQTARWVAGIFEIIPVFGSLILLVASLYSLYTLYLGTVPVERIPQEKALGFTIVVIVAHIVAIAIITFLLGILLGLFFIGAGVATGAATR